MNCRINILLFFWLCFVAHSAAQSYNMTSGTVTTCSGTFYDPGGTGNYGNSLNITETFCATSGNCLTVNFTSFRTQGGNDILYIYDGPTTASPLIGSFSGTTSPGLVTSSTGCLTFRFVSNATTVKAGWEATINCTSCATGYLMNNNNPVSACSGLFYDSGGPSGNYGTSDNYTKTFCSSNGSCIQLEFISFNTKNGDLLSVYNGPTTSSPLIGTYSGTSLPPVMLSTTGCLTVRFLSNGNAQVGAGWAAIVTCEVCPSQPGTATYTHPVSGMQNAYVGANMVTTCGGTFTDNGGTGSNYSNGINNIYRTFCPDQAGKCLRATFWNLDVESLFDRLTILNGPTQNSPQFGSGSAWNGTINSYEAALSLGMGPYISTDQSGCLTFRFSSDNTTNRAGWVATFDCIPCANGPNGMDNNDCRNSVPICSDQSFTDASTGPGIVSEGYGGCVLSENFSNWYKIVVQSSGTLGLNIVPNVTSDDYDFALYQSSSCSSLGSPLRCSYAANTGTTGMDNAQNLSKNTAVCGTANNGSDTNEDVCGNGWVNSLNVTAGEELYLLVNKWSPGGSGFTLNWVLSGGATLNCTILPIELIRFDAQEDGKSVRLDWETASEINNDYFLIERSVDGKDYFPIQAIDGAGNSTTVKAYRTFDTDPLEGLSYYRLKQIDFDGSFTYSRPVAVRLVNGIGGLHLVPNPASSATHLDFTSSQLTDGVLEIFDTRGKRIYSEKLAIERGRNDHMMDLSRLDNGVYVVSLSSPFQALRRMLVVK